MDQQISNEIFVLIFNYLSLPDRFQAFYGLNSRINMILNSMPIKLDKLYDAQVRQYVLPNINPAQVHVLKVFHNGSEKRIDIQQFTNVQCLKFYLEPSINQLDHIRPTYLPHLTSLSFEKLSSLQFSDEYANLCKTICTEQFRKLKEVKLPYLDCKQIHFTPDCSNVLTHLEISYCTKSAFYMILENLSNLETFRVTISTNEQHQLATKHAHLRELYLTVRDEHDRMNMSMDELFGICRCLRDIKYIMISMFYSDTIQNACRDLNAMLSFCQSLEIFDFFIKIEKPNFNDANIDEIKQNYGHLKHTETYTYQIKKFYYCCIKKSYFN